ncbi:MAG: inorganic triphosphatase [Neptuniibacter sp.]|jgi:triphosphatase
MATEIELKLTLSPHHVESLISQPLFRSNVVKALGSQELKNTYFDTPDQLLTQHKVALRIREKGDQLIQTLKSSGISEAGLHTRNEWEWLLKKPELDYELLQEAEWPSALNTAEIQSQITHVFSTDFTRTLWILDSTDYFGNPLKAEIALDQGSVSFGDKEDQICELELELLEGDPSELIKFASDLAKRVPLFISDVSKAERGYRLHNPEEYQVKRHSLSFPKEAAKEDIFCHLLMNELGLWPRFFEAWRFNRNWENITEALESLRNTDALFESFGEIIPVEPDGAISQLLIKLIRQLRDIDSWRRTAELTGRKGSVWHSEQAERAAARIDVLLQTAEPGLLALLLSKELVSRSWRSRWNEQQEKLAQEPL